MTRRCEYIIGKGSKKAIYIDSENRKQITAYLTSDERHKEKWRFFVSIITENLRHKNYCKVDINSKCKDVWEMRFFVGQENDRIYCKEVNVNGRASIVVLGILHERKKATKLSSKEIELIEKLGSYEYEIQ